MSLHFHPLTRSSFRYLALVVCCLLLVSLLWSGNRHFLDKNALYKAAFYVLHTKHYQHDGDYVDFEGTNQEISKTCSCSSPSKSTASNSVLLEPKGSYPLEYGEFWSKNTPVGSILTEGLTAPDIHYLWCGQGKFEFRHYLGVMSVIRTVRPDKIYLHYEHKPEVEKVIYNQWLDDLKYDYPWLHVIEMEDELLRFCTSMDFEERVKVILGLLNKQGGMFVSQKTWMLNFPPAKRCVDFDFGLQQNNIEGYVLMQQGVIDSDSGTSYQQLLQKRSDRYRRSVCARVDHIYSTDVQRLPDCLLLSGDVYERLHPKDIWELDDPFGRLTRKLFYGTEEIRRLEPSYDELVPKLGHVIWFGGGRMDYLFYLSVLSILFVAEMDNVYVHGDLEPAGEYWKELKTTPQTKDRIKFIRRTQPLQIYQQAVRANYKALMSDIVRADLMVKYGGVYTDTDAIWVKPLSEEDRGYEAVASFDWVDWSPPYPEYVNFGVTYGKKNALFWRLWLDSFRNLQNYVLGFNGCKMPYKILEKYPHVLRIDRQMQVICYRSRCHPIWVPDYHNMSKDHTNMNSIPNWREDVNVFHWTHPNPPEYANRTTLLSSKGMFAEIGKNVLELAGLL